MTEHRCQFIHLHRGDKITRCLDDDCQGGMCDRIARCQCNGVWFCAEHYDRIVGALGPETQWYGGTDLSSGEVKWVCIGT